MPQQPLKRSVSKFAVVSFCFIRINLYLELIINDLFHFQETHRPFDIHKYGAEILESFRGIVIISIKQKS